MLKTIIRRLAYMLIIPFLLCSCNQEDDVLEIFNSGVWNLENFYSSVNWGTNSTDWGKPEYTQQGDLKTLHEISIVFDEDGTFTGKLSGGGTYSGRWEADPTDRSFSVSNISTNIGLSGKNHEYIKRLEAAKFYRGDSRSILRLAPENRTSCIQFTHRK